MNIIKGGIDLLNELKKNIGRFDKQTIDYWWKFATNKKRNYLFVLSTAANHTTIGVVPAEIFKKTNRIQGQYRQAWLSFPLKKHTIYVLGNESALYDLEEHGTDGLSEIGITDKTTGRKPGNPGKRNIKND